MAEHRCAEQNAHMAQDSSRNWTDDPIQNTNADEFERTQYASRAADLIVRSHSWESSVVFGVTGPWGSGKSSLINLILEALGKNHPDWSVARFTPWATGDVAGLLEEFYLALSSALPGDARDKFRKAASVLTKVAAPATGVVPIVGAPTVEAMRLASEQLAKTPPWEKAFTKAAERLQKAQTPILVVADDIDRLQTAELLELLKVVRLLGRFPGVQYLLAYDEKTLSRTLQAASLIREPASAERYMEKIVQYPLVVPPMLPHQLQRRLINGLRQLLADAGRPEPVDVEWTAMLDVISPLLVTPRAVDRYLAQLRHHLPLVPPGEINDIDLILLILVRVRFPSVFAQLFAHKYELVTGHGQGVTFGAGGVEPEPADLTSVYDGLDDRATAAARALLAHLFPKLDTDEIRAVNFTGTKRISDKDYFDRYFVLIISENDVADADVASAISLAIDGDSSRVRDLLTVENDDLAGLAITKGQSLTNTMTSSGRRTLLTVLASTLGELRDQDLGAFSLKRRVIYWMSLLLIELDDTVALEEALHALEAADDLEAFLVWDGSRRIRLYSAEPAPWFDELGSVLCQRLIDRLRGNLEAGDEAPDNEPAASYINLALGHGRKEELKKLITNLLTTGDASIAGIAARFVEVHYTGPRFEKTELAGFAQDWWDELVPSDIDDEWYDLPVDPEVDTSISTWENRRRFAQGRVQRPRAKA